MISVFYGNETKINEVYSSEIKSSLHNDAGLLSETVMTKEALVANKELTASAEYLFSTWGFTYLSEKEIALYFPNLKAVFYAAGSVQHFAQPFLARGIKVFSAWGANAGPVAEYTVAQIILANKGFFGATRLAKQGYPIAGEYVGKYPGNYGCTVGIIGAGMIGKLVIQMLKSYRLHILVFDPFLSDEKAAELGVEKCSLERLFLESQTVSNHLANNAQTVGMLNYSLFSRMRDNATFINTGRGAQIVEDDLVKILTQKPGITAVLDVTYPEPPAEGHPFYTLSNVVLTPHIAGSIGDEVQRMAEYMLEEFNLLISGRATRFEVSEEMLKTMA